MAKFSKYPDGFHCMTADELWHSAGKTPDQEYDRQAAALRACRDLLSQSMSERETALWNEASAYFNKYYEARLQIGTLRRDNEQLRRKLAALKALHEESAASTDGVECQHGRECSRCIDCLARAVKKRLDRITRGFFFDQWGEKKALRELDSRWREGDG